MGACTGEVRLRRATEADADEIATVHVETWREAYRDLLPASFLAALSVERRATFWRSAIRDDRPERPWVADVDGEVVGFVSVGPSEDEDAEPGTGEVHAIYVAPACWGRGIGRRLLAAGVDDLEAAGHASATLWVLERNDRARRFYELAGWKLDGGRKVESFGDVEVAEVRYRLERDTASSSSR